MFGGLAAFRMAASRQILIGFFRASQHVSILMEQNTIQSYSQ